MAQTLSKDPAVPYVTLLTFRWGTTPNEVRYCSGTDDLTVFSKAYTNAPEMDVVFDKANNIGTEDAPVKIQLRGTRIPVDTLISPYPHATVNITIAEIDPLRESTFRSLYFGKVSAVEANIGGNHLLQTLILSGIKARLNQLVGLQALSTCVWPFGDENNSPCKVALAPLRVTGTVTERTVDGNSIRIDTNLDETPYLDLDDVRWKNGYVSIDDNKIKIRQSLGDGRFDLISAVPPSWVDQEAIFTPGCDKSISACRYWDNEDRFMGFGIGMPGANPVYSEKR